MKIREANETLETMLRGYPLDIRKVSVEMFKPVPFTDIEIQICTVYTRVQEILKKHGLEKD